MLAYDPNADAYAILGVDPGASQDDVEAAYRKAALTWHPDKSPAPDAAERFVDVQRAGQILRDPDQRRFYDLLRTRHIGRTFRPRRPARKPAEPWVPMRPPPAWLASSVRVHLDAVLLSLETPRASAGTARFFTATSLIALGSALWSAKLTLGLLAVVLWALGRLFATPPHHGQLAWAKIVPGRKVAEYHSLDQRRRRYQRLTVPFEHLRVAVIRSPSEYRIEIHGFPHAEVPVLLRTQDIEEARRCAREAGQYLQLPLARAA